MGLLDQKEKKDVLGPVRGMTLEEMTRFLQWKGYPSFRGKQIFHWVYEKGVRNFSEMTSLSKDFRQWLEENAFFGGLKETQILGSSGETQKILFKCGDEELVESVLMRNDTFEEEEEKGEKRTSMCVSSQIGCPLHCGFCVTGTVGFRRNLRVDEIIDQILVGRKHLGEGERISNLVFMGMGEPLLNLDALIPALQLITNPQGMQFSTRRITVSTAGVIPGIDDFACADTGANLAVSLNATTQKVRDQIMPGCKKWPLKDLLLACRRFPLSHRRRITFEYVLLNGINDTLADLKRLKEMLRGIPCKINLILYNADERLEFEPTDETTAKSFQEGLLQAYYTVSLRRSKGRQHRAACGQLAAHRPEPAREG